MCVQFPIYYNSLRKLSVKNVQRRVWNSNTGAQNNSNTNGNEMITLGNSIGKLHLFMGAIPFRIEFQLNFHH